MKKKKSSRSKIKSTSKEAVIQEGVRAEVVPYDENLLERARTQWQFGDWESLSRIDREALGHHPERAKLALLAAAGCLQINAAAPARQFIRLAQEWGCSRRLVSQILVAGVHNSLGRVAAIAGDQLRALKHFEQAIGIGTPGAESRLLVQARASEQLAQLGIRCDSSVLRALVAKEQPDTVKNEKLPAGFVVPGGAAQGKSAESSGNAAYADITPNPYSHNRVLTPELNTQLLAFSEHSLGRKNLKPDYIRYLAAKAIQIERNCVGRLATTVQDAVVRQLVAECVPGKSLCMLEIGALYGVGLAILYNHAITRYHEVRVIGLDPFDGYYGNAIDAVLNSPVNDSTFMRNMRLSNVPDSDYLLIKRYSTDPVAITAAEKLPVNLLIIDGDHTYKGVKFDFDTYVPFVSEGGFIILDDYDPNEYDVKDYVDKELLEDERCSFVGIFSRTAIFRKNGKAGEI
jgi:hypothetical protein